LAGDTTEEASPLALIVSKSESVNRHRFASAALKSAAMALSKSGIERLESSILASLWNWRERLMEAWF